MPEHDNNARGTEPRGGSAKAALTREALLALSPEDAEELLEREDPALLELMAELIREYSARAGERLKSGGDYLDLLSPAPAAPAVEALAMLMVLEALEEELDSEE